MTARAADGASGFTLLEVLVTLAIAGLLMAALSGGLQFGLTAVGAQNRMSAHNEDLVVIDQAVRKLVEHAAGDPRQSDKPFHGEPHRMSFVSLVSAGPESGGVVDVAIGVDGRHRLVAAWRPFFATSAVPVQEVLAEGVDHVDLSYAAPAGQGEAGWRTAWDSDGLPGLVRLHLVPARKTDAPLPDIVAATRLRDRQP